MWIRRDRHKSFPICFNLIFNALYIYLIELKINPSKIDITETFARNFFWSLTPISYNDSVFLFLSDPVIVLKSNYQFWIDLVCRTKSSKHLCKITWLITLPLTSTNVKNDTSNSSVTIFWCMLLSGYNFDIEINQMFFCLSNYFFINSFDLH